MKKHILTLMIALFIGAASAFAQLDPRPVECLDLNNPLTPVPGNPYTYSVEIPTPPGTNSFRWFVTQDQHFINAGVITTDYANTGGPILYSAEAHYTMLQPGANSIELVWQSWVYNPSQPVFVVVEVRNDGAGGSECETMNLKAYKIEPLHAFTLDIANVLPDGTILGSDYGSNIDQCVSDIADASYDFDNDQVVYDFGENTLHFAVVAANWAGQWQLRVDLQGLVGPQVADIFWGYNFNDETYTIVTDAAGDGEHTSINLVMPSTPGQPVGSEGEIIHIKVVIKHFNYELIQNPVQYTFAVNGNLHDGTNIIPDYADIHHVGADCVQVDFDDVALQSITPRPEVVPTPGAPDFMPIAP